MVRCSSSSSSNSSSSNSSEDITSISCCSSSCRGHAASAIAVTHMMPAAVVVVALNGQQRATATARPAMEVMLGDCGSSRRMSVACGTESIAAAASARFCGWTEAHLG
jgi:ABC-type Fe3+-hydroxamate transport system substrate-binding protein